MGQRSEAYDLSVFENRSAQSAPRIRVQKGDNNRKLKQKLKQLRVVGVCVVLVSLICGLLYSQATLTELTTETQRVQRQLSLAHSEHDYLQSVMDSKTGVKNVEEIARSQLGLVKIDKSQITYATLEEESVITRPRSSWQRKLEELRGSLLSVMDYLNP